ncbi:MAG: hypothetical protein MUF31_13555, partial [Akkermansiaceae bacterium]|nr:hypothetical protein [Akkermansiaceae bacterium]
MSGSGGVDTFLGAAIVGSSAAIAARGFNMSWSTRLSYAGAWQGSAALGGSWTMPALAGLSISGGVVSYSTGPGQTKQFVSNGAGAFQATYFTRDVLSRNAGTGAYTLLAPDGSARFFDSSGRLTSFKNAGGVEVTVTRDGSGVVTSVKAQVGADSWEFVFVWDSINNRFSEVIYKVNARSVLRQVHSFESTSGWLRTIQIFENSVAGTGTPDWGSVPISAERFTYHSNGALRHVVPPTQYRQMAVNGLDPATTTDMTAIGEYAETEYEYDSAGMVSRMFTHGRRYELGFSYATGSLSGDLYNTWRVKTLVSRPGNVRETYFLSAVGQVLLRRVEQMDGAGLVVKTWYPVFQSFKTDGSARLDYTANAEAINASSFSESSPTLVSLYANEGLITLYSYNSFGLQDFQNIKKGTSGTVTNLRAWTYTTRSTALGTVRPIASETVYGGSSNATTTYSYLWHTNSLQASKVTVQLPVVPVGENGTGAAQSRERFFDVQGYLERTVDTNGAVTFYAYRKVTGAMTQKIINYGTGPTFLNLTTDYETDDRGRTVRELGPEHSIDLAGAATAVRSGRWTYYKDREGETWSFGGYRLTDLSEHVVGAVSVERRGLAAPSGFSGWVRNEMIQAEYSGSGLPAASSSFDTLFPRTAWRAWSLSLIDKATEKREQWTYWTIPATGFGLLDTDYGRKLFDYDSAGRQNQTTCAGGTTDRATYNAMGWVVAEELGTLANGLTVTRTQEYDAAGRLTKVILPVDGTPANDRVTLFGYDWRGRRIQEEREVEKDGGGWWKLIKKMAYDGRDQLISVTSYHTAEATGNRTGYQTMAYDTRGRMYRSEVYAVDTSGATSNPQISQRTYDGEDRLIIDAPAGSKLVTLQHFD